jgi:acetyltransferase-like isoleucine patch superfamily enzyme
MSDIFEGYNKTCSIENLKDGAITFARNFKYFYRAMGSDKNVLIIIPEDLDLSGRFVPKNIIYHRTKHVDYEFTLIHNKINKNREPAENVYGRNLFIHPSSVIFEGIRIAVGPCGERVQMKHVGNIVFGYGVNVGALTLIERAELDSTVIGNYVQIDGRVTVGHNTVTGDGTVIASGAVICGSCHIGKRCWIGANATIKQGVKICDDVVIGMGSCVTKEITEPGIYMGSPAKFYKKHDGNWTL